YALTARLIMIVVAHGLLTGVAIAQMPLPSNGVITQPGHYFLQQDLFLSRATGITIEASNVTLDLAGFAIRHIGSPQEGTFGIVATGQSNIRITNGTIGGFWFNVHTGQDHGLQIDNMIIDDIPYIGINTAASYNVQISDNTFTNFRYDIPKATDQYLVGINIGAEDAVVAHNSFDAEYTGSTPNAPGVETVLVLFSSDVSRRCEVNDNVMAANVPLDRSYGLWVASNAYVTATHNTIENMRYGVTLASNATALAGYNSFTLDPPDAGVPTLPSTYGVYAPSAKQVFTTGNKFQGQSYPTLLPPSPTGDWDNTDVALALTVNDLSDSLSPGVGYDSIEFPGTFTHGGSISVDVSSFQPGPLSDLKLVGWTAEAGSPANTAVSFTGGPAMPYEFRSDGLYVTTPHTLVGDYNNDGLVDSADYVVWRKRYNTSDLYQTWRTHFAHANGGRSNVLDSDFARSSVPEPSAAPISVALALVAMGRRTSVRHFGCRCFQDSRTC
ncbi:MAG TPA: right-handed parallel beta-helix repeat-containing protein, partial [Lacipirellulaceae bacterium]|nr:right-handed parallel beta-helix repeat-containing protein [Lacipirellulaceae bacterium]